MQLCNLLVLGSWLQLTASPPPCLHPHQVCEGLRRLTGSPVTELNLLTGELTEDHDALAADAGGAAGAGAGVAGGAIVDEVETVDRLWAQLLSFHSAGFLMGASCNARDGVYLDFEEVGLMPNHAYSVLEVLQVGEDRLVRLHNPWGRQVIRPGPTHTPRPHAHLSQASGCSGPHQPLTCCFLFPVTPPVVPLQSKLDWALE
jgi:hypothetical protein